MQGESRKGNQREAIVMRKSRWKIWLLLVVGLILGGVFLYNACADDIPLAVRAAAIFYKWLCSDVISAVSVSETTDGWLCSAPVQYELNYLCSGPILCGSKLVILERYKNPFGLRSFLRDTYYIRGIELSNGHTVYRSKVRINGHPLQVLGIFPWGENVVVWGYYQEEPGLDNRISSVSILNSQGEILKRFPLNVKPTAVDEKNNLLICGSRLLELPSGKDKFQTQIKLLVDMVSDKNGNVYILRRLRSISEGDKNGIYDALAEKYSCVPWKKLWSVKIPGTADGYPIMLRYENGLVWYAIYDERGGPYPEDRRKWTGGPLDPETGAKIETQRKFDPYTIEAEVDAKVYVVTKVNNKLYVKTVSK